MRTTEKKLTEVEAKFEEIARRRRHLDAWEKRLTKRRGALQAALTRAARPDARARKEARFQAAEAAQHEIAARLEELNEIGRDFDAQLDAVWPGWVGKIGSDVIFLWTNTKGACAASHSWHYHWEDLRVCVSRRWFLTSGVDPRKLVAQVLASMITARPDGDVWKAEIIAELLGPAEGTASLEKVFSVYR